MVKEGRVTSSELTCGDPLASRKSPPTMCILVHLILLSLLSFPIDAAPLRYLFLTSHSSLFSLLPSLLSTLVPHSLHLIPPCPPPFPHSSPASSFSLTSTFPATRNPPQFSH